MKSILSPSLRRMMPLAVCFVLSSFVLSVSAQDKIGNLQNNGFEQWTDTLPTAWMASGSSIEPSSVFLSQDAYSGRYSCRLVRTQKAHVRFNSDSLFLPAGRYQFSYYVKGKGSIRNTYLNGKKYATYSPYDTLQQKEWKQIVYAFELKNEASIQMVFSICQTDSNGLWIDETKLESVASALSVPELSIPKIFTREGVLHLDLPSAGRLLVLDVSGRTIINQEVGQGSLEWTLPKGMYLLRFADSYCDKFVIR